MVDGYERSMADPDPRHHADPMHPGPEGPREARDQEEEENRSPRTVQHDAEAGPDRDQSDEDSPGEALVRESRGEPVDYMPEPNEPA
jgi:hypothetical protein